MRVKRVKAVLSAVLALCFVIIMATGLALHYMRTGMLWIFTKRFIHDAHAVVSYIMTACVALHLILNRKIYRSELKAFAKKDGREEP